MPSGIGSRAGCTGLAGSYPCGMAVPASGNLLVGRVAERAAIDRLLADVVRGVGGAVLVEGEAGIGKTRLVHRAVCLARERRVRSMVGAARLFETNRPFGPVREALGLRGGSPDVRRAEIARLMVVEGEPDVPHRDVRWRIVEEIVDLVESESRDGPLLLALEDLHWADDSTVVVVRSLLDRLAHVPVLLVASVRPSPRSAALDVLLADASASGAEMLRLTPLTSEDVDALVRAETGQPAGPALVEVMTRAGGNPLWVVEILRSLRAEGLLESTSGRVDVTAAVLPASFRQLVLRRLRDLPDATLRALRVAAVLGDRFSLVDLATVSGRRAVDLLDELAPALQAHLLADHGNELTFRHQLVHEAIYQDIPRAGRVAMHGEAARVLADAGAPWAQVATHVLRSATAGDLRAVGWLRAAAADALPHAPDVAVDLLVGAEGLLAAGRPERDLVTAELVEALLRAGRVGDCARWAEAALRRRHRSGSDARIRLALVSALSLQNRAPELIAQAEAALTAVATPDADRALILAQVSYGRIFSGELVGGERAALAALELAQGCGDVGMTVWSLTTLAFGVKTQGRYGEAVALTERAVRLADECPGEQGRLRHPHFFLGMALCDADRTAEAREAYRIGMAECMELGSSWLLPDIQQLVGELHVVVGAWDDALVELGAGLKAGADRGNHVAIAQSTGYLGMIHAARGDLRLAEAALAPLAADVGCGTPTYGIETVAHALALVAEARGQPDRAYELLRHCWRRATDRRARRFQRCLAPALVRLGLLLDHAEAAAQVADAMDDAAALAPDVPSIAALARRCRGWVDSDPEALLHAVSLLRASPRFLDRATTLEDAAAVLASASRAREAQSLLVEALEHYERMAADAWAARVRAALRKLGVRHGVRGGRRRPTTGWASLTDTERAVARLVAEGLTNREVGTRLFISAHTVNTHLRHLFQKLGVRSRTGLTAAVLAHLGRPGPG